MIKLRPYQESAIESIFEEWKDKSSTLIVAPTGCGKTTIFTEVVRRASPKRSMILVHREELMKQARERIIKQVKIECDVEMAEFRASTSFWQQAPCVIATVQTMYSGNAGKGRMAKFNPEDFGILICDEAHHYVSPSYRRVIDYFRQNSNLKVLGVTATPDRADEIALGQIFDSVAHDYEILDAIHDGWLVPVDQQMVRINGLDFSGMRTNAGDLNGADLAEIMEKEQVLQGVASSSIDIIGNKRALAFTSSVRHAEMLSDIFNRHREGMSVWICGKTPKLQRAYHLDRFKNGEIQVMVNCGVLTEGFDCPEVEVIIQARPTKSRCLYAQIIGRSLRPLPGIVDALQTNVERKKAIAESPKKSALIIDFVGNAGKHKLMSSADILGGKVSMEAIERAVEKATQSGEPMRMDETLDEEEERIRLEIEEKRKAQIARKERLVAKANYTSSSINPFEIYQIEKAPSRGWDTGKLLSEKQKMILLKMGVNPDSLSYSEGNQLLREQFRRWNNKLCTLKQAAWLNKKGYDSKNMLMKDAGAIMDAWAKNGWKRPESEQAI